MLDLLSGHLELRNLGSNLAQSRAIMDKLRGTGSLMIVDEAHYLSPTAIDQMRAFYDSAEVGLVLQGNEQVVGKIEGGARDAAFAPLYSRVGFRLVGQVPHEQDTPAWLEAAGITDEEQVKLLRAIGAATGALRAVTKVVKLARMLATADEREMTAQDISLAHKRLTASPKAARL